MTFLACYFAIGINWAVREVSKPARSSTKVNHNCPSHSGGAHFCKSNS